MKMTTEPFRPLVLAATALLLGACTVMPTGPNVMVLPGTGRTMDSFRADDLFCRDYAYAQIGGRTAQEAANQSAVASAVVGTAVGAAAGAAFGGSQGAAVGAGTGLLFGSAVGASTATASGYGSQRQYDNAYVQCMYTKGHRVPIPGNVIYSAPVRASDAGIPPPPPGAPPPPPPDVPSGAQGRPPQPPGTR
jgi:Glycine-zipper domain